MRYQLDLNEANKVKKNSENLTADEKSDIMTYLKNNQKDANAIPFLMKKYNVSQTTITILIIQDRGIK